MRLLHLVCAIALSFGCGDDSGTEEEPYDTFQDCFDDHHLVEAFDVNKSIKICCLDHPIGGQNADTVCGENAGACVAFVGGALDDASATDPEIATACDEYLVERNL